MTTVCRAWGLFAWDMLSIGIRPAFLRQTFIRDSQPTIDYAMHKYKDIRGSMMAIHKAKDNSFKAIFGEPELFFEFLRDFIDLEIFDGVTPEDIEDVTERFLPLFQDGKDSDTVKRINLKGDVPLFVIAIVEHESEVNYRASFKLLQYIALVLADYEKEANKKTKNISFTKGFKFPPVLPIVFYDGIDKWTAETNFLEKVELNEVFHKYIPKFEYELVGLSDYSKQDLIRFGGMLSLIMIIDKIRTADDISILADLPSDYIENLQLNIPPHLCKLLADVIAVLLKKINVPDEEIDAIAGKIYERRIQEMFTFIDNYDVQETRRIATAEGLEKGIEKGIKKGIEKGKIEGKIEAAVNIVANLKIPVSEAMRALELQKHEEKKIVNELKKRGVSYVLKQ